MTWTTRARDWAPRPTTAEGGVPVSRLHLDGIMQLDEYLIRDEPYYRSVGEEVALFEAAYASRMPIMLKGPTGCGKTRFIEHMAWRLKRPLITVACHEGGIL